MTDKTKLEHLVRAAQRGEPAALAALVGRFQPLVWAAARRLAPAPDDAEDLAQEGNLALVLAVRAFRPAGGAPFAWYAKRRVYWAVQAAARRLKRGRSREEATLDEAGAGGLSPVDLLEDPAPGPEDCAIAASARAALRTAWDRLTPRQRQVLSARAGGATFPQVAAALGIAPSSAKGIAARGTARLKKLLAGRV
jgi:RNA polymerase sigma-70 factor (ECF subfamily)